MVNAGALLSVLLPAFIPGARASVDYPPRPDDLTTPYQQRLAIYGPNGGFNIQLLLICLLCVLVD